ncbi:MAG: hypothetical protein EXR86_07715 [Gammaproteobacteria bacterium]|nr:hypothetical protein [Gammaproteobacteria bacterium]
MEESSWGLRLALLLIGIAVIIAVYLLSVMHRRRRSERYRHSSWSSMRYAKSDEDDLESELENEPLEDEIIAVRVHKAEPLSDLPIIRNDLREVSEQQVEARPTRPSRQTRGRRKRGEDQLSLGFPGDPALVDNTRAPPTEPTILTLYLRPRNGSAFSGSVLVRNANVVGLRHGEHQIFHHFGAGDLRTERALFSLANMYEPGYFDLGRIEAFQTAGLVMFMNLPAGLDGAVAFELFLNTAQRLAEGLQADLLQSPKTLLDSTSIDEMRRVASQFPNAI